MRKLLMLDLKCTVMGQNRLLEPKLLGFQRKSGLQELLYSLLDSSASIICKITLAFRPELINDYLFFCVRSMHGLLVF